MPQARVNTLDLHYQEAGQGFPLVLVHGFAGSLRDWDIQLGTLSDGYRVIALDLRGHGHSEKPTQPEDYELELMAEDALALMRHLGLKQCCLVGHSMGGIVAQCLALAHPEPLRALVLVGTAAEAPPGLNDPQRARLKEIARQQGMEAVFEERLRNDPLADALRAHPELLEERRREFLMTSREAYLYCGQAMARRLPLLGQLRAITLPTLIVCGEEDAPFLEPSRRMHLHIPKSELAVIPGASHSPQVEQPEEFNRVLLGFLSRIPQSVGADS